MDGGSGGVGQGTEGPMPQMHQPPRHTRAHTPTLTLCYTTVQALLLLVLYWFPRVRARRVIIKPRGCPLLLSSSSYNPQNAHSNPRPP